MADEELLTAKPNDTPEGLSQKQVESIVADLCKAMNKYSKMDVLQISTSMFVTVLSHIGMPSIARNHLFLFIEKSLIKMENAKLNTPVEKTDDVAK